MTGRVDAHHHVWDLAVRDQPWIAGPEMATIRRSFTADDLVDHLGASGVTATVVVQTVVGPEETPELLALAEESDVIAAVTGWADLTRPDVGDTLAQLRAGTGGENLKAIRHQVQAEPDAEWLIRPDVCRGLAAVAEAGLVFELLTLPNQLPAACTAVAEHGDLQFVLDHCSKPPIASGKVEPWASALRALARYENVSCKLSGLVTEADWATWTTEDLRPYVDVVLDAFGPDRVLFGSDWPVCLLAATYGEVVAAAEELTTGLTNDERAAVFGGNARRVYAIMR